MLEEAKEQKLGDKIGKLQRTIYPCQRKKRRRHVGQWAQYFWRGDMKFSHERDAFLHHVSVKIKILNTHHVLLTRPHRPPRLRKSHVLVTNFIALFRSRVCVHAYRLNSRKSRAGEMPTRFGRYGPSERHVVRVWWRRVDGGFDWAAQNAWTTSRPQRG